MIDTRPRIVLDTNVVVSAALGPRSIPADVLRFAFDNFVVLCSDEIALELRQVLFREKFDRFRPRHFRTEFFESFYSASKIFDTTSKLVASVDPDDNKFLELAVDAKADVLVSGDDHLLRLHPFQGIPILKPLEFLERRDEWLRKKAL